MRPLFFDFPNDPGCANGGRSIHVRTRLAGCARCFFRARPAKSYLPAGARWTDAWTGKKIKGGRTITAAAPLERVPLYLRGGRKLPINVGQASRLPSERFSASMRGKTARSASPRGAGETPALP